MILGSHAFTKIFQWSHSSPFGTIVSASGRRFPEPQRGGASFPPSPPRPGYAPSLDAKVKGQHSPANQKKAGLLLGHCPASLHIPRRYPQSSQVLEIASLCPVTWVQDMLKKKLGTLKPSPDVSSSAQAVDTKAEWLPGNEISRGRQRTVGKSCLPSPLHSGTRRDS